MPNDAPVLCKVSLRLEFEAHSEADVEDSMIRLRSVLFAAGYQIDSTESDLRICGTRYNYRTKQRPIQQRPVQQEKSHKK